MYMYMYVCMCSTAIRVCMCSMAIHAHCMHVQHGDTCMHVQHGDTCMHVQHGDTCMHVQHGDTCMHVQHGNTCRQREQSIVDIVYIYQRSHSHANGCTNYYEETFMSSCVDGSKAPPGTISAIYTRYAGTISTSYKNVR